MEHTSRPSAARGRSEAGQLGRGDAALHAAIAGVVLSLRALMKILPSGARAACGNGLGRLGYVLMRRRRRLVRRNIELGLGVSPEEAKGIARACFRHFGRLLTEALALSGRAPEKQPDRVETVGLEHLEAAFEARRGVILLSAHIGDWEGAIQHQAKLGLPADIIARSMKNPWLNDLYTAWREGYGNRVVEKRGALMAVRRAVRENGCLAALIDHHARQPPRRLLPFLGRSAMFSPGLVEAAVRFGMPVVPFRSKVLADGRNQVVYWPALQVSEEGDDEAPASDLMRQLVAMMEDWIRDTPEQWFWLHDRWKET